MTSAVTSPGARSAAVPAAMSAATAATHSSASPRRPSSELRSGITSAQDWLSQTARPTHSCRNWPRPNPDRPDRREFCPDYALDEQALKDKARFIRNKLADDDFEALTNEAKADYVEKFSEVVAEH